MVKDNLYIFDRAKPFYPYVLAAVSAMHGGLDLASRRVVDLVKSKNNNLEDIELVWLKSIGLERYISASKTPTFLPEKGLGSTNGEPVMLDWDTYEEEAIEYFDRMQHSSFDIPLRMLLIACYESTKDKYDSNDPLWQFFFHCRNAAAHNGYFTFKYPDGNSRKITKSTWNEFEITSLTEDTPLFTVGEDEGLLKSGDIIKLLMDVENKIIAEK